MTEIWFAVEWFVWGFAAGFVAQPSWRIARRIWQEVKQAQEQWSQPRG